MLSERTTKRARQLTPDAPKLSSPVSHDAPMGFHERRTQHMFPGEDMVDDDEEMLPDFIAARQPDTTSLEAAASEMQMLLNHEELDTVFLPELRYTVMRGASRLEICVLALSVLFLIALLARLFWMVFGRLGEGAKLPRQRDILDVESGNARPVVADWDRDRSSERIVPTSAMEDFVGVVGAARRKGAELVTGLRPEDAARKRRNAFLQRCADSDEYDDYRGLGAVGLV